MSGRWVHSHVIETSPDICFEYILFVQKYPDIFRVNLSVQDKLFHELTKFVAPMPLHIMTFIFSCLEQLNGWPCHSVRVTHSVTQDFTSWHTKSDRRDLWSSTHLIRVTRRHYLRQFWQFRFFDNSNILTIFEKLNIWTISDIFGNVWKIWFWRFGNPNERQRRNGITGAPFLYVSRQLPTFIKLTIQDWDRLCLMLT